MRNMIEKEYDEAKSYMIETDKEDLAIINMSNVAKVEAMIATDSKYRDENNTDKEGSMAYCMNQLCLLLKKSVKPNKAELKKYVFDAIVAVDKGNGTRLSTNNKKGNNDYKDVFELMTERVVGLITKDKEKMLDGLKNRNLHLFEELSRKTEETAKPSCNVSFASKFCHYFCFYYYKGEPEQDNYSIYDSVVKKYLPKYLEKYNIVINDELEGYEKHIAQIDALREKVKNKKNETVSRNGLDHLLWYYHKGK